MCLHHNATYRFSWRQLHPLLLLWPPSSPPTYCTLGIPPLTLIVVYHRNIQISPTLSPHLSIFYLAAATFVGIIAAIVGLLVYRVLVDKHILSPKVVLIINAVVISGAMVYVLYSKSVTDLFIIAAIVGTQVGPINAFSRSIVSRLTPTHQQSKFFSLYEFSQVTYLLKCTDIPHLRSHSYLIDLLSSHRRPRVGLGH